MLIKKHLQTILLILIICFNSCKKDLADKTSTTTTGPGKDEITISGTILRQDGYPQENALITVEGVSTHANSLGFYNITCKVTDADKVIIKATYPGFFECLRSIVVEKQSTYGSVVLYMKKKVISGSLSSVNGGTISMDFASFTFPSNGFMAADGTAYNGKVNISAYNFLNSTQDFMGDMRGIDDSKQQIVLESHGGFNILAEDEAGNMLKLAKPMNFTYKLENDSQYTDPIDIKLWNYDNTNYTWTEKGKAKQSNNAYSGSTTSMGLIQFALPHATVLLKVNLIGKNIKGVNELKLINLIVNSFESYPRQAPVNSNGVGLMYVPVGAVSKVIAETACSDMLGSFQTLFEPSASVITKDLNANISPFITSITGLVEDCDFKVIDGYAEIEVDHKITTIPIIKSVYNFTTYTCDTHEAFITVYDSNKKLIANRTHFTFDQGENYIAADIDVCTIPIQGSLTITVEGKTYTYTSQTQDDKFSYIVSNFGSQGTLSDISFYNALSKTTFGISAYNIFKSNFPVYYAAFSTPGKEYRIGSASYYPHLITIDKYRNDGVILQGSFKIMVYNNLNYNPYTNPNDYFEATGSFKLWR